MEESLIVITHQGDRVSVTKRITAMIAAEGAQEVDVGELQIDTETLKLILSYCTHHGFESPPPLHAPLGNSSFKDICEPWDKDFVEELDEDQMLKLCLAAKALGMGPLVQLLAARIALLYRLKDENAVGDMLEIETHMSQSEEVFMKGVFEWAHSSTGARVKQDEEL